ncbi:MAG TPA: alpha/beta hydrolase [Gaiellales bacterium]|nr:alpha/beta hydrolase [Gaiellales bacterium]
MTAPTDVLLDVGIRVRARVWPGPADTTLVAIAGLGCPASDFDRVSAALARRGRMLVIEGTPAARTGRGGRAVLDAALLRRLLRAEASRRTLVIGHSMGAFVAMRAVAAEPGRVAGLILSSAFFPVARNGRSVTATAVDYARHRFLFAAGAAGRRRARRPVTPLRWLIDQSRDVQAASRDGLQRSGAACYPSRPLPGWEPSSAPTQGGRIPDERICPTEDKLQGERLAAVRRRPAIQAGQVWMRRFPAAAPPGSDNTRQADVQARGSYRSTIWGPVRTLAPFGLRPGRFHAVAAAVDCPVLVVHGSRDHHVPPAFAAAAAARHPRWRLAVIDGAGHFPHRDSPDAWLAPVEAWLDDQAVG